LRAVAAGAIVRVLASASEETTVKRIVLTAAALVAAALSAAGQGAIAPDASIFKDTMVDLTWQEVQEAARAGAIVLLPIAVVEEHGPQLDLSPDIELACMHCRFMKRQLERKGVRTLIAPPYYWGINTATARFPGSFTVSPATLKAVLADSVGCLKAWGFTKVFYVNLHGDMTHRATLAASASELEKSLGIMVRDIDQERIAVANEPVYPPRRAGKYAPDYHAGSDETAAMWAFHPERVRKDVALGLKPASSFANPLGYVGDPASFLAETSIARIQELWAELLAMRIEALLASGK
jgi:creatinine amidohydrolase